MREQKSEQVAGLLNQKESAETSIDDVLFRIGVELGKLDNAGEVGVAFRMSLLRRRPEMFFDEYPEVRNSISEEEKMQVIDFVNNEIGAKDFQKAA